MNFTIESLKYVAGDYYFVPSMAIIAMMGIFIGAVIYNGDVKEIKKVIAVVLTYAALLAMANLSRIIPLLGLTKNNYQPLAGMVTLFFVTIFYVLGMGWGVYLTKKAHNGKLY